MQRVEIRSPQGRLCIERSNADSPWRISSPFESDADQRLSEQLMRYLLDLGGLKELEAKPTREQLKAAGLSPPFAVIGLRDFNGGKREVSIGDASRNPELVFIRQQGGIWLASLSYRAHAATPFSYFRDRRVLRRDPGEVVALSISGNDGRMSLRREGDGWWLTAPERAKARDQRVEALLNALTGPVVIRYLGDEDRRNAQGIQEPSLQIDIDFQDGAKGGVIVGSRASGTEFYARLVPDRSQVTFAAAALPNLRLTASEVKEAELPTHPSE
ncbi:MAG: DUF4340 domain-containing protein [Candidatus Binatia bacterium]